MPPRPTTRRSASRARRLRRAVAVGGTMLMCSAFALAPTSTPPADAATLTTVRARAADGLPQMAGVNTRMLLSDTPYKNYPAVKQALLDLGVRNIREYMGVDRDDHYTKLRDLAASGIKSNVVMGGKVDGSDLAVRVRYAATELAGALDSIESLNEWNNRPGDWVTQIRGYQKKLWALVNQQPALNHVKVLGPSLARRQGYTELGDLSAYLDTGNIHLYSGGGIPSVRIDEQIQNEKIVAGNKGTVVTEGGYHNALNDQTTTHFPTSEAAAGVYMPRWFLEYFSRGVKKAYSYELYDHIPDTNDSYYEAHFGLINRDGSRKPAFHAVSRLMKLVADPGPSFTPGSLSMSVESGVPVRRQLVQKRNGQFVLLLWQDASVWDFRAERNLSVPTTRTTVRWATTSPMARADVHRINAASTPQATLTNPTSVSTDVGAGVTAIVLTPKR